MMSPREKSKMRKSMPTDPKMRLGMGGRFEAVKEEADESGAKNPAAVAAAAGRKKYGAKKMAQMAAAGRKRAAKSA